MKPKPGMTLLEVVVAGAIIAIVMMFLGRGFVTSMYMSRQSDEYAAAARASRDIMEEIVSMTIVRWDRTPLGGNQYQLKRDPVTNKPLTAIDSFNFTDLPSKLTHEFAGGKIGQEIETFTGGGFVTSGPGVDPFGRIHPFRVYLSDIDPENPNSERGILPGIADEYAGEVVIIDSEALPEQLPGSNNSIPVATQEHRFGRGGGKFGYGGDLFPRDGSPDGFQFFQLPVDLDCNGTTTSDRNSLGIRVKRYPVGVIVRWMGKYGPERYETWTIISKD